jgi:hypothetical protein
MQNSPSVMGDDEEAVENAKGQRQHGEEIHPGNNLPMTTQKRGPSLCRLRTPRRFPHPTQDSSFRNIEAKHREFAVDAWRTPGWILGNHAKDQVTQF